MISNFNLSMFFVQYLTVSAFISKHFKDMIIKFWSLNLNYF